MSPTTGDGRRGKRVAELVRGHFTDVLRRELDDPAMAGVVVTEVEVTADLSIASIHVRLLGPDDEKARKQLLTRLKRAQNILRRALAPRLALRKAPELRFYYDAGHDAAARVEELLGEIERDKHE
ncbi:MAG TPA: 30S ribosome-binding factor RbfA [Polyangiaceae bacterium]|nr:30S ribosome-binding factor RbfA [Polyangiaceae bacterium]